MVRRLLASMLVMAYVVLGLLVFTPTTAHAASAGNCARDNANFLSFPTWYKYLGPEFVDGECKLTKLRGQDDVLSIEVVPLILMAIFEIILRIVGIAAVIGVIYGGFQYLTSTGEPDKAKNARTTIINSLVGLMIAIFSVAIVNLVARNIG